MRYQKLVTLPKSHRLSVALLPILSISLICLLFTHSLKASIMSGIMVSIWILPPYLLGLIIGLRTRASRIASTRLEQLIIWIVVGSVMGGIFPYFVADSLTGASIASAVVPAVLISSNGIVGLIRCYASLAVQRRVRTMVIVSVILGLVLGFRI